MSARAPMQTSAAEFHRQLRSLFAVLRILVRQTSKGRDSVEDYSAHLEGRVGALARVHEMLMRAPEEGVDLEEIVCGELLAQVVPEEKYLLGGPEIRIARESAAALGLAFHELTVNAMTHGALSSPRGRVEVRWIVRGENGSSSLQVQWNEHDVRLGDTKPSHKGFGMELIERMLPYELSARTAVDFSSEGVRVQLLIPQAGATPVWRSGTTDSP
jgi:two-component system CheB/CheR fusion protein